MAVPSTWSLVVGKVEAARYRPGLFHIYLKSPPPPHYPPFPFPARSPIFSSRSLLCLTLGIFLCPVQSSPVRPCSSSA